VRFFRVYDEQQREIAAFYLDPYSRPAEKRGGAWMDECVGRSRLLAQPGHPVRLPVAYLVCNQTPPVDGRPSLMTFNEVKTLFHEFGHGLQHMLTTVDYGLASGIRNVEWDAVELPSQFMENWCYHRETLLGLSAHVETGAALPEALYQKLYAARNYRAGSAMLRQLYFAFLDLELHHRFDPSGPATVFEAQQRLAAKTTVLPPLPEDRFLCSFGHIFAGGYAAGYYSYKWAEVLSADAFAAFEEVGLENAAAVTSTGRRYRQTILALGGSRHPMEVFQEFRGRQPTTAALLRHAGLAA
jgi:oligopeptidase A